MTTRIKLIKITSIVIFFSALSWGCASKKINLLDEGLMTIERAPSKENVYVSSAYASRRDSAIVVSGKLRQHNNFVLSSRGHVDIAVISPDGKIIKKASTNYMPERIRTKHKIGQVGRRPANFWVRLPGDIPPDSMVRVAYHNSTYSGGEIFYCGDNVAVE